MDLLFFYLWMEPKLPFPPDFSQHDKLGKLSSGSSFNGHILDESHINVVN